MTLNYKPGTCAISAGDIWKIIQSFNKIQRNGIDLTHLSLTMHLTAMIEECKAIINSYNQQAKGIRLEGQGQLACGATTALGTVGLGISSQHARNEAGQWEKIGTNINYTRGAPLMKNDGTLVTVIGASTQSCGTPPPTPREPELLKRQFSDNLKDEKNVIKPFNKDPSEFIKEDMEYISNQKEQPTWTEKLDAVNQKLKELDKSAELQQQKCTAKANLLDQRANQFTNLSTTLINGGIATFGRADYKLEEGKAEQDRVLFNAAIQMLDALMNNSSKGSESAQQRVSEAIQTQTLLMNSSVKG